MYIGFLVLVAATLFVFALCFGLPFLARGLRSMAFLWAGYVAINLLVVSTYLLGFADIDVFPRNQRPPIEDILSFASASFLASAIPRTIWLAIRTRGFSSKVCWALHGAGLVLFAITFFN